jgi:rare lipoprotein A
LRCPQFSFAQAPVEYVCSPRPPRRPGVGAGALSPEKGGALRKQSTQGRRLGVAAVLCGVVFAAPLLLLQHGSAHAPRVATGSSRVASRAARSDVSFYSVVLPSQMVTYEAAAGDATAPTTVAPTTTTTAPAVTAAPEQTSRVEETSAPVAPPTVAPRVVPVTASRPTTSGTSERGQATWYAAAPPGRCASPTLPFGTVLTVTNVATGATTTCTVDDREQAGYPRVVDMSPSGFAQLADPSQGVVDVTISW